MRFAEAYEPERCKLMRVSWTLQHYNRVFGSRNMGDAEIVIVVLGSAELRCGICCCLCVWW